MSLGYVILFLNLFINVLSLAVLGLHCWRLLLLEVSRGWLLVAGSGFLIAVASLVEEHGLSSVDSALVVHGFLVLLYVESSQSKDQTYVPCIGR